MNSACPKTDWFFGRSLRQAASACRPAVFSLLLVAGACSAPLLAGEFQERFDRTWRRVLESGSPRYDLPLLLADLEPRPVRRFTEFSGDLSGRYLGAVAAAAVLEGDPRAVRVLSNLRRTLERMIALQRPNGRFGAALSSGAVQDDDMARLWGQGRMLVGLLEYHRATQDSRALQSAQRLGDFLVQVGPRFNHGGVRHEFGAGKLAHGYVCWTQNIEGLAALYQAVGDQRYVDLAASLAARIERRPGQHSHGLLTSLRGLVALAEATGDERYLDQAASEWRSLAASENLLPAGMIPEYFAPGISRDEGCSQADWVRLGLSLWRATGDRVFLEHAEHALFNALLLNQSASGDFGHLRFSATGLAPGESRAWWCCTLHGLRAFPAVMRHAFRLDDDALHYDLPVDAAVDESGWRVRAEARLWAEGRAILRIEAAPPGQAVLAIRRPAWAPSMRVQAAGAVAESEHAFTVERVWKPGDVVEIKYEMTVRSRSAVRDASRAIYEYGPFVLGVAEGASPAFFDEPFEQNRLSGRPRLDPGSERPRIVVDYAPAGYGEQPAQAELRPMALRRDTPDGRWTYLFPVRPESVSLAARAGRAASKVLGWAPAFGLGTLFGIVIAAGAWALLRRRPRTR